MRHALAKAGMTGIFALIPILVLTLFPALAFSQDTDGDGVDDAMEASLGSDPSDPEITPGLVPGPETRVSHAPFDSTAPALVWTGSEYGVAWEDYRDDQDGLCNQYWDPAKDCNQEIYFARLSAEGNTIGPERRVSFVTSFSEAPTLAWTGSEFVLGWQGGDPNHEYYTLYFASISASGQTVISEKNIFDFETTHYYLSFAWTGSELGASWTYYEPATKLALTFFRFSAEFDCISLWHFPLGITGDTFMGPGPRPNSLVWTGSEFGLGWDSGGHNIFFTRLSSQGAKIGADLSVASASDLCCIPPDPYTYGWLWEPSLAWTGTELGMIWKGNAYESPSGWDLFFARISAEGVKIGNDLRLTEEDGYKGKPRLIWEGLGYGFFWEDQRNTTAEIYFARITAEGARIGPEWRVTFDPAASASPSPAWTGSEYGLAWQDNRDGNFEIYFTRFSLDSDGDGLTDRDEVNIYLTDPGDWDTDGDGIPDGADLAGDNGGPRPRLRGRPGHDPEIECGMVPSAPTVPAGFALLLIPAVAGLAARVWRRPRS